MLAIDQRGSLQGMIGSRQGTAADAVSDRELSAVKRAVTAAIAPLATAVLTDPLCGYPGSIDVIPPHIGILLAIVVQHDVTSPRPNVRFNMISGTKAFAQQYPRPQIALSHDGWLSDKEYDKLAEQYRPEISKRVGEMARQLGGHGGVDTLMAWRFIDCLRNGLPLDMDVYDAALWSSIAPLSEWSVANRSNSIDVPDFTSGSWQTNKPGMDIELAGGGTTKIA